MKTLETIRERGDAAVDEESRDLVLRSLVKHGGSTAEVAAEVKIGRGDLYKWCKRRGIDLRKARAAVLLGETDIGKIARAARLEE